MPSFYTQGGRPVAMMMATFMTYLIKQYRHEANLVDAVIATPVFQCTDPRDHLYSLLGLSSRPTGLEADYGLPAEEVCMRFATATIVTDRNLKVLSLAPHTALVVDGRRPARLQHLPSWVPDLTCQGAANPLISYTIREQIFHAGGDGELTVPTVSHGGRLLHLRCRIIDSVAAMTVCTIDYPVPSDEEILPQKGFNARIKMRMRNRFRDCWDVAAPNADWQGPTEAATDQLRLAFHQTLLCGMTGMRDPLSDDIIAATQAYVDHHLDCFTPGYVLSEQTRDILLMYGGLVESSLLTMAEGRRFCRTEAGRLGQIPAEAEVGDLCAVIMGAEVPYILRPSLARSGAYMLVGDCFLFGVMQGEALADDGFETVDIIIE